MLLMLCSNILGSQCDAVGVQLASYKIRSGRPLILSPQIDLRGGRLSGRRCLFLLLLLLLFLWCVVAGGLRIAKFGCAVANNGVGSYSTTRLVSGPYAPMNWAPQSPLSLGARAALPLIVHQSITLDDADNHWSLAHGMARSLVSCIWSLAYRQASRESSNTSTIA